MLSCVLPAAANPIDDGPGPPTGVDPFCGAQLSVAQWDFAKNAEAASSDRLIVAMFAGGKKISATLVLVSERYTLSVDVPTRKEYPVEGGSSTEQFYIALPIKMHVKYAYVESYAIDGGKQTECSVEPFKLGQYEFAKLGFAKPDRRFRQAYPTVGTTFEKSLPLTTCDTPDADAVVVHAAQPDAIPNLDKTRTAVVAVYVDERGLVAKTYVTRSSGIDVADDEAQEAAMHSVYRPALVHCVPVNAAYLFVAEFDK
jgi:hypothetical protein